MKTFNNLPGLADENPAWDQVSPDLQEFYRSSGNRSEAARREPIDFEYTLPASSENGAPASGVPFTTATPEKKGMPSYRFGWDEPSGGTTLPVVGEEALLPTPRTPAPMLPATPRSSGGAAQPGGQSPAPAQPAPGTPPSEQPGQKPEQNGDKDTIDDLWGGLKNGVDRAINDWKYGQGWISSQMNDEEKQRAIAEYALKYPEIYKNMSPGELEQDMRRMGMLPEKSGQPQNPATQPDMPQASPAEPQAPPVEPQSPPVREQVPPVEMPSPIPETDSQPETPRLRREDADLHAGALKMIAGMRNGGMDDEQIRDSLDHIARFGGEGTRQMEQARQRNRQLAATSGWGTVGATTAGIAQQLLPLGVAYFNPPVAAAMTAGNVLAGTSQNFLESKMELENYERESGAKLTPLQRNGYLIAATASGFLVDALLQSRYLGNVTRGLRESILAQMKRQLVSNPVARAEMMKGAKRLAANDRWMAPVGLIKDMAAGSAGNGIDAAAQELATMIYRNEEDYPEIRDILESSFTGAWQGGVTGAAAGGVGRRLNRSLHNRRRAASDEVFMADHPFNGRVEVVGHDAETGRTQIVDPESHRVISVEGIPAEEIRSYSPEALANDAAVRQLEGDPWDHTVDERRREFNREMDKQWKSMSVRTKYKLTRDLTERMGLENVYIYERSEDLPENYFNYSDLSIASGIYESKKFVSGEGSISIILDKIDSYTELQHVILHEAAGHKGLDTFFSNPGFKNLFLKRLAKDMPDYYREVGIFNYDNLEVGAEEYLADLATYNTNPALWQKVSGELRYRLGYIMPGLKVSDSEMRTLMWKAKESVRKNKPVDSDAFETIWRTRWNENAPAEDRGRPLQEVDADTYRRMWETDPQWQGYKRLYDAVYGDSPTGNDVEK